MEMNEETKGKPEVKVDSETNCVEYKDSGGYVRWYYFKNTEEANLFAGIQTQIFGLQDKLEAIEETPEFKAIDEKVGAQFDKKHAIEKEIGKILDKCAAVYLNESEHGFFSRWPKATGYSKNIKPEVFDTIKSNGYTGLNKDAIEGFVKQLIKAEEAKHPEIEGLRIALQNETTELSALEKERRAFTEDVKEAIHKLERQTYDIEKDSKPYKKPKPAKDLSPQAEIRAQEREAQKAAKRREFLRATPDVINKIADGVKKRLEVSGENEVD